MTLFDFESVDDELLTEVIRQADARLAAQLTLAQNADQRAMTFAGLTIAGTAAIAGSSLVATLSRFETLGVLVVACGLTLSSGLACWSARPTQWEIEGNEPDSWIEDVSAARTLKEVRPEIAAHLQQMITDNAIALASAAFWMKASMVTALVSIAIGIATLLPRP